MRVGPMKIISGDIFHPVQKPLYKDDEFSGWSDIAYFPTIQEGKDYIRNLKGSNDA